MRSRKQWHMPEALACIATTGAELLAEADAPVDFVIDRLAEAEDLVLIAGREKLALKTMLAIDLGIARIIGAAWLGFDVARGDGRVLYVSPETGVRQIGRRMRGLCKGRGADAAAVADRLVIVGVPISMVPRELREVTYRETKLRLRESAYRVALNSDADVTRAQHLREGAEIVADTKVRALGQNLDALAAIEDAPRGTWSLIIVDTLRATLKGSENDSSDCRDYMQACRELARAAGCPLIVIHHTSKHGEAGDARSARGSVEITAAPDLLISIDATTERATVRFTLRNHEAPEPVGYRLAVDAGSLRIETCEASAAASRRGDIDAGDVLAVFQGRTDEGLPTSTIRRLVAEARGCKPGTKANAGTIAKLLNHLAKQGSISRCRVEHPSGLTMEGWRLGSEGGTVPARPVEARAAE